MALPKRFPLISYLPLEDEVILELNRILRRAAREISRGIALVRSTDSLTKMQMEAQLAAIKAHLAKDWKSIEALLSQGHKDAAAAASKVVSEYENELLKIVLSKDAMSAVATSEAARAAKGIETVLDRVFGSGRNLSKRVYNTQKLVNGQLERAINTALLRGMNSREFALYIKQFISPSTPGGASYAAQRLARTEINNAYHWGSQRRYEESGIVLEVDWNLSASHPEGDICDDLASQSPYPVKRVPDKPHPQCYCFITPRLPDRREFIDNLLTGKYGDEPWEPYVDMKKAKI